MRLLIGIPRLIGAEGFDYPIHLALNRHILHGHWTVMVMLVLKAGTAIQSRPICQLVKMLPMLSPSHNKRMSRLLLKKGKQRKRSTKEEELANPQ